MENGAGRSVGYVVDPVVLAECLVTERLDAGGLAVSSPSPNVFGAEVHIEPAVDALRRVERAAEHAAAGHRVGLIATASDLSLARAVMARMAEQRLPAVFHVLSSDGAEALCDLGWGVLFADGAAESFDLSLVARRASEDCGTPFLVVHENGPLTPIAVERDRVAAFIGAPEPRGDASGDVSRNDQGAASRDFAARVPFALGSALRDIEAVTGRKHDFVTRTGAGDAQLMLLGLGALGGRLTGEVDRLRQASHDVAAVKLTVLRPFPGPRIVRLLARALAITVLERKEEPLAQSSPLTREVKAAFADALTWAPDYPGIGRIPRIHTEVVRTPAFETPPHHVDAVVRNMLEADHAMRGPDAG